MACPLQVNAQFADAVWPFYHGDPTASHYSELGQITKENVGQLEVALTYHSSESLPEGRTRTGGLGGVRFLWR